MGVKQSRIEYVDNCQTIGIVQARAKPSSSGDSYVIRSHSNTNVNNKSDVRKAARKMESDAQPNELVLKVIQLSSCCDVYRGENHNYAGFILYAHNGQTKWELNGRTCEIGLLIIKDSESEAVKRHIGHAEGMIHGPVYKSVFNEDIGNTVGEGFSVQKGKFEWNSRSFNARQDTFHDQSEKISEVAKQCVSQVLKVWMKEGEEGQHLPSVRRFTVKELLRQN